MQERLAAINGGKDLSLFYQKYLDKMFATTWYCKLQDGMKVLLLNLDY